MEVYKGYGGGIEKLWIQFQNAHTIENKIFTANRRRFGQQKDWI